MNPPYIPVSALGGDIISGWSGEIEINLGGRRDPRWVPAHIMRGDVSNYLTEKRLNPRREEVATRIATVLRARGHEVGHLLPVALGGRQGDVRANAPIPASCLFHGNARRVEPLPACTHCGGSGRVPFESDEYPQGTNACCCTCSGCRSDKLIIPAADVSALTLAASVAGEELGRGEVGVVYMVEPADRAPRRWVPVVGSSIVTYALEATAAILADGNAYLDPSAPFGVRVPFLTAEASR